MQCWQSLAFPRRAGVQLAVLIATSSIAMGLAGPVCAEPVAAAIGAVAPMGQAIKTAALDQRPVTPIPDGLPAGAPPAVPAEGLKSSVMAVRGSPLPPKRLAALPGDAEVKSDKAARSAKPMTLAALTPASVRKPNAAAALTASQRPAKAVAEPSAAKAEAAAVADAAPARASDGEGLKAIADRVKQQLAIGASKTARELLGEGWTELMLQRNDMAWSFCESALIVCDRAAFGMKAVPYQRMWIRADEGYDVSRAIEIGDLEAVGLQTSGFADWVRIQPNARVTRLPDTDQGVPAILVTEAL